VTDGVPEPLPEDVAQMLVNAQPPPEVRRAMRRKLVGAVLIAVIGLGASFMSCIGQSFGLRQARALEGIEQQLGHLQQGCQNAPAPREGSR
jgi:hypothetical protein